MHRSESKSSVGACLTYSPDLERFLLSIPSSFSHCLAQRPILQVSLTDIPSSRLNNPRVSGVPLAPKCSGTVCAASEVPKKIWSFRLLVTLKGICLGLSVLTCSFSFSVFSPVPPLCKEGGRILELDGVGSFVCIPNLTVSLPTVAAEIEVSRVSVLVPVLTFVGCAN